MATAVHVRDLAFLPPQKVWAMKGRYEVTFDDNVVLELAGRHIKLSWPYWGVTRRYNNVPIPSSICYKPGQIPSDDYHIDLMSKVNYLGRKAGVSGEELRFILSQSIYADAFNLSVDKLLPYCTTLDVDTLWDIMKHPDYAVIPEWAERYPTGYDEDGTDMVEKAYQIIEKILKDKSMDRNVSAMSVRDRTLKVNQILQSYIRGKTSGIDSRVHSWQVWEGLFVGMNKPASRLKEADATSRAHIYNTENIAMSEYASRKLQLAASVLMSFYIGDCGTKDYHIHTFHDTKSDRSAFKDMVGMYFRLSDQEPWRPIVAEDWDAVVGRELHFRSTMTCLGLSHQTVCSTCLGDLAFNFSKDTSPGILASSSVAEKGSQGILSTKHLDFLRKILELMLTDTMRQYLDKDDGCSHKGLVLAARPARGTWDEYSLAIPANLYSELSQVAFYEDIDSIDETSLPDINELTFMREDSAGLYNSESIDVRMGVCGNFSKQFLDYFTAHMSNCEVVNKMHLIPLKDWDMDAPIIQYTNRSESMAEFVMALETKIRSVASDSDDEDSVKAALEGHGIRIKNGVAKTVTLVEHKGSTEAQCTAALFEMHRFVKRKLDGIPMTHLATILAISRVESLDNAFPAVGFDPENLEFGKGKRFVDHNRLMGMRSLGPMFIYQWQQEYLNNVSCYTVAERPASLFDGVLATIKV